MIYLKTAQRLASKALDHASNAWMTELQHVKDEANIQRIHIADDKQLARLSEIWRISGISQDKFIPQMQAVWSRANSGQQLIITKLS
jgi:tRNA A37 N6-isopentenylltransferase MiaA